MMVRLIRDGRLGALELQRVQARFLFRRAGSYWRVVFDGSTEFYLPDTLGAQYLDYLLHHPNRSISAFDLETAVQPEKEASRERNSIQRTADTDATRAYLRELTRLRAERERAVAEGNEGEVERIEEDMAHVEGALRSSAGSADSGERARGNVRKAIGAVLSRLEKGGKAERDFAAHLRRFLSTGYECMYSQQADGVWM